jgi:hypothetical protein
MFIEFLSEEGLDKLKKYDLDNNLSSYQGSNDWLYYKYPDILKKFDKKEFNDFDLICSSDSKDDFDNMKIIYEALKYLTDSQASDERVWTGLAHTYCWKYMQERWPLPEDKSKWNNHVLNNYFFWNSTKAVFLNGISRLWWYARYTYNDSLDDPYELTRYICENDINGKIFPLVSCVFASNKKVFQSIIKSIKEYEEINKTKLSREEFNELKTYLNRYSGIVLLDFLSEEELKNKIFYKLDLMKNV